MQSFRAFRIHQEGGKIAPRLETIGLDDLAAGEVVIKVGYSSINYKDALAATGAGKILRKYPLVGGIDLAGDSRVVAADPRFQQGEQVLVHGCDLGVTHDGGYARVRARAGRLGGADPGGHDAFEAMAIGTAGFTAALAIHRMEQNGSTPRDGAGRRDRRHRRRRQRRHRHARARAAITSSR